MASETSEADSPAGMMMLLPPADSLGAVVNECDMLLLSNVKDV